MSLDSRGVVPWLALATACTTGLGAGCEPQGRPETRRAVRPLARAKVPDGVGTRALRHVERIVALGPRHPGSQGHEKQLDYICAELRKTGLEPILHEWTDPTEKLRFTNVTAAIRGEYPERVLLACHHDTKNTTDQSDRSHVFSFVGANDGGSGVGLLLALAPLLAKRANKATIQLVFFDGEESLTWEWNGAARALFGSKKFVKDYRDRRMLGGEPRIAALVLLDMVGRKDLRIQEETSSTAALREILWSAAVATGHEKCFFGVSAAASDDHTPFLDAGIPSVDLLDLEENPHWHKPTDTIDNLSAQSLQIVAEVVLTMLPEIEREYLPPRPAIR
ncbi:MAG: M28 family peptidase [Planctomycetota bacterium]